MEYGRSLVLQSLLHAREVVHEQTRELQIVCPACSEPIHKRGSDITKATVLLHITPRSRDPSASSGVFAIVCRALHPTIIVPRGQELQRFLAQFEEIVLDL